MAEVYGGNETIAVPQPLRFFLITFVPQTTIHYNISIRAGVFPFFAPVNKTKRAVRRVFGYTENYIRKKAFVKTKKTRPHRLTGDIIFYMKEARDDAVKIMKTGGGDVL